MKSNKPAKDSDEASNEYLLKQADERIRVNELIEASDACVDRTLDIIGMTRDEWAKYLKESTTHTR
jgi:hypothetical protein